MPVLDCGPFDEFEPGLFRDKDGDIWFLCEWEYQHISGPLWVCEAYRENITNEKQANSFRLAKDVIDGKLPNP